MCGLRFRSCYDERVNNGSALCLTGAGTRPYRKKTPGYRARQREFLCTLPGLQAITNRSQRGAAKNSGGPPLAALMGTFSVRAGPLPLRLEASS